MTKGGLTLPLERFTMGGCSQLPCQHSSRKVLIKLRSNRMSGMNCKGKSQMLWLPGDDQTKRGPKVRAKVRPYSSATGLGRD
jgi:hypothetical protein